MWRTFFLFTMQFLAPAQEDPAALYAAGVEHYNVGDYEEAVRFLERARRLEASVPDYRYHLGLAYLKVGRAKEAASELEATLGMMGMRRETRLKEPMVLVQAAIAYLQMGNFKAAGQKVELALARDPSDPDAFYVRGLLARERGDVDAAVKAFEAALELDRDHPQANLALAEWLEARGELQLARENLRHASHSTRSFGDSFEILMALGAVAFRLGDVVEAEESFAQALEERPDRDDARFNLGAAQLSLSKHAEAANTLRPLVARDEPHDRAAFNLGLALRHLEDYRQAREILESLLGREPGFDGASFLLAIVAEAMGDDVAAEKAYREAIRDTPNDLSAFLNLAALLERLGRRDEALSTLEAILELTLDEAQERIVRDAIRSLESNE